jgi:hypothetical protein
VLRAGVGTAWTVDYSPDNTADVSPYNVNAAGFGGADLVFQRGHWGARLVGRAWALAPYSETEGTAVFFWSPQAAVEAVYEF